MSSDYLGGIMRSLHRYSSAAMVVAVTLHLLREFVKGVIRAYEFFLGIRCAIIVVAFLSAWWLLAGMGSVSAIYCHSKL